MFWIIWNKKRALQKSGKYIQVTILHSWVQQQEKREVYVSYELLEKTINKSRDDLSEYSILPSAPQLKKYQNMVLPQKDTRKFDQPTN